MCSPSSGDSDYALTHVKAGEKDLWIAYIFIYVFGFVGALLVFSGIHRWIASRVRETMVEIESEQVPRGRPIKACFRQEGPVMLSSLRANVLCFERTYKWGTRTNSDGDSEQYRTTDEKLLYQQNILDEHDNVIAAEDIRETLVEFQLPDDTRHSTESEDRAIVWKIEVRGKVKWWPDFMHPFVIEVV